MASLSRRAVTLIELIVAIIIVVVVILAINNLDIFSRYHLISSDRRAKLQNDVSRGLEHITKSVINAIGSEAVNGNNTVVLETATNSLSVFIDGNQNGVRDAVASDKDYWIGYRMDANNNLIYCSYSTTFDISECANNNKETIARNITAFNLQKGPLYFDATTGKLVNNYLDLEITACYNPAQACGTQDNPSVTMNSTLTMPSVSTN
jgi:prepilin-type N-terminal cleavage/methylation domain-containing protein